MKHPHVPAFICCALVVLLATVPLAAQPVVDTLRSQTVRVDISGLVATTTVEQVWAHFGDSDAQATFQFRLPSAAVVTDLALWVDGLRCPGEIYPRSAARAIYRQIVDRKRDPALMEYVGDGVWQLQVFPISPKSSVKVDFTYTQLLTPLDGWVVYDSLVTPDANEAAEAIKAGELSFQATIRAPGGVTDVKSATHKLGVQRLADGAMVVGVRKENADLAKGLQMSFKPGKALPATIILSDRDRSAFVGSLKAPKELLDLPARKINAILVLDASLSMAAALTDARAAIVAALDQLGEGDTFNIVVMSSDVAVWRDKPQPADAKNKQDALAYLGKVSAGGGTDLPAGLRAAAAQASDPKARYELMVFTDGQDTVAATVATACPATMPASHPSTNPADNAPPANCRIFGLGSYDCSSLTTLAEWTGGAVVDNFKPPTAAEIVKLARRPAVTDAHCAAVNAKELGLRNVVLGEMTRGECLVAGQFDKEGQGEFVVSARIDGNAVELRQSLPLARDGGGWVDARGWGLWIFLDATQKLRDIHAGKAPAGDLMAIIEASRKYHVLTPATSLLVLENDQAYIDRGIERQASIVDQGQTLATTQLHLAGGVVDANGKPTKPPQQIQNILDHAIELVQAREYDKAGRLLAKAAREHPQRFEITHLAATVTEISNLDQAVKYELTLAQQRQDAFRGTPWYQAACTSVPELPQPPEQKPLADANAATQPTEPAIDAAIAAKLAARLPKVEANKLPLQNVLTWYAESTGLKLDVDWKSLEEAGINPQSPVSIHLKDVAASAVLSLIAHDLSNNYNIGYVVEKGTVVVSLLSHLALSPNNITRVYDCRDLVPAESRIRQSGSSSSIFGGGVTTGSSGPGRPSSTGIPAPTEGSGDGAARIFDVRNLVFTTSALNTNAPAAYGRTTSSGDSGVMSIFGNCSSDEDAYTLGRLVRVITWTIDRNTWADKDAESGSIRPLAAQLVVTQTPAAQAEIAELLARIRAARKGLALVEYEPALRKKLQVPLKVDLKDKTAADAFAWFASAAGVNVHVCWSNINPDANELPKITIQNDFPTAQAALDAIVDRVFQRGAQVGYELYQGMILISNRGELRRLAVTAVYGLPTLLGPNIVDYRNLTSLKDTITGIVDRSSWSDSDIDGTIGHLDDFNGVLVVQQTPRNIIAVEALLKQMARMKPDLPKTEQAFLPSGCAESLFTADGRLAAWAFDLATRAKAGKLSQWSSVQRREAIGRKFVYVGGYWIEESVTDQMKIVGVAPGSPAAGRLATVVKDLDACLHSFECVILAAGPVAIADDAFGLSKEDDPELVKLMEKLKK